MEHGPAPNEYKDLVVFLAAAGVLAPLFSRFRISPILGFLAAGVLLGPDGVGRLAGQFEWVRIFAIADPGRVEILSQLGVVFLMFMIGLELSWERLKSMRRLVFGLGMMQILTCAAILGGGFLILGQNLAAAAVFGFALALSSTAVVMPVMAGRGRLASSAGRATFSVLLAQDLAVAPILVMVAVLAAGAGEGDLSPQAIQTGLASLVPAIGGLVLIVILGRLVLRPLFRSVARAQSSEMFLAACLFVVLGTGILAQLSGLSMAIGALAAGLLLAETEFRREIEVVIEPFKGLLLGFFFVSTGVSLDLDAIIAQPVPIIGLALAIIGLKAAAIFGLARLFRLPARSALETAMILGPAGEFAFVILSAALAAGVVPAGLTQAVLISATLSLFTVPVLAGLTPRLKRRIAPEAVLPDEPETTPQEPRALVVGYGRVGRLIGDLLREHDVPFVAVDTDPQIVAQARRGGQPVWYGDAARPDYLERLGLAGAEAVIVTMDAPGKVDEVVKAVRALRADMVLVARARDEKHAARLYELGVTDAVPETTEASLQLAENALVDLGVPMGLVLASIHQKREDFRAVFQAAAPKGRKRPTRALRSRMGQTYP